MANAMTNTEEIKRVLKATDPRLRLAVPEDTPAICGLYEQLAREQWVAPVPEGMFDNVQRFLEEGSGGMIVVVEAENRVGGMAAVAHFPDIAEGKVQFYIDDLIVDELLRDHGLGTALLEGVGAVAKHLDACLIHLHVREDNEDARRFYKHHGYHRDVDAVYFMNLPAEERPPEDQ